MTGRAEVRPRREGMGGGGPLGRRSCCVMGALEGCSVMGALEACMGSCCVVMGALEGCSCCVE